MKFLCVFCVQVETEIDSAVELQGEHPFVPDYNDLIPQGV
jgi:hypothetical protein